ncbi:MAG: UDP-N-acetylmuramoyl-L-alanine--D-glutamate ligase [bacterium]
MSTKYRHAIVLGLGASGESAARLLRSEGARVAVVDAADHDVLRERAERLCGLGAEVILGATELSKGDFDICVLSPGMAADAPWVNEVRKRGVPVVPELELGWSRFRGKVVAVTGTNGKSTAVKWIAESLNAAGFEAVPAGNYGLPATQAVMDRPGAPWLVLEVSSFQSETMQAFRPDVGLLLNMLPNHLDRHRDMEAYVSAKARLFSRTEEGGVCVVHAPWLKQMRERSGGNGRWVSFGLAEGDYRFEGGAVRQGGAVVADIRGTYFDNEVLGCNAAGILAVLDACGIGREPAECAARAFKPLPHRMQEVAVLRGVTFINDSKATTLTAMAAALRMCRGPVRLIAGGLLKEDDLSFIKEILAQRAVGIYLMGRASEKMASAWSGVVPCFQSGTLNAALASAWRDARAGETILLSPGCASFDQFRSFEDRGQQFRELVSHLSGEESSCNKRHHGVC